MKMMKKLMALVLASALALTLLTGCGGGGGGSISDGQGGTITIGSAQNANTEFSEVFINALASYGIDTSYETAKGTKAQNYIRAAIDLAKKNPYGDSDELVMKAVDRAGIDITKEMVFQTEYTSVTYQVSEIMSQMDTWAEMLDGEGIAINYDGATFGYAVARDGSEQIMCVVVGYTASKK